MALDGVVNGSAEVVAGSIASLGKFALLMQAVGVIIIINIAFQVMGFVYTRKMNNRLKRIENILNIRKKK